jgi:hypothetical protein
LIGTSRIYEIFNKKLMFALEGQINSWKEVWGFKLRVSWLALKDLIGK